MSARSWRIPCWRGGPGPRLFGKASRGWVGFTPAERRILKLIAEDKTSKEIADVLGLSARTVENHRTNICAKLDVHGVHGLVKFAYLNKSKLPGDLNPRFTSPG